MEAGKHSDHSSANSSEERPGGKTESQPEKPSGKWSEKTSEKKQFRKPYRYVTLLSNHQRRIFERQIFPGKLSAAQARVLHYLLVFGRGTASRQEIEEEFGMRPPSATELLKTLEKNGLIRVSSSGTDARKKEIRVTDRAKTYLDRLQENLNTLEAKMTEDLTPEELAIWSRVNEKMIANMKAAENREKIKDSGRTGAAVTKERKGKSRVENVQKEKDKFTDEGEELNGEKK